MPSVYCSAECTCHVSFQTYAHMIAQSSDLLQRLRDLDHKVIIYLRNEKCFWSLSKFDNYEVLLQQNLISRFNKGTIN